MISFLRSQTLIFSECESFMRLSDYLFCPSRVFISDSISSACRAMALAICSSIILYSFEHLTISSVTCWIGMGGCGVGISFYCLKILGAGTPFACLLWGLCIALLRFYSFSSSSLSAKSIGRLPLVRMIVLRIWKSPRPIGLGLFGLLLSVIRNKYYTSGISRWMPPVHKPSYLLFVRLWSPEYVDHKCQHNEPEQSDVLILLDTRL